MNTKYQVSNRRHSRHYWQAHKSLIHPPPLSSPIPRALVSTRIHSYLPQSPKSQITHTFPSLRRSQLLPSPSPPASPPSLYPHKHTNYTSNNSHAHNHMRARSRCRFRIGSRSRGASCRGSRWFGCGVGWWRWRGFWLRVGRRPLWWVGGLVGTLFCCSE